jgi:hypothetical protein
MSPPDGSERRRALALLAAISAVFVTFLWLYVPRMNNYVMSDREFTGWVGPIAERMVRGERPYVDFVLPIPPGSMMLLAFIQKLSGRALLLQELSVAAVSHWLMGLLGYAIARPFTTRRGALLVAIGTLVLVLQTPKECVYDHTSHLTAWGSIVVGVRALLAEPGRAPIPWFVAGLLAGLTLVFKQSTAVGIIAGWALAVLYLGIVDARAGGLPRVRRRARDAIYCAAGGLVGLGLVGAIILASGSTLPAFYQAVFGDAPELKGGRLTLLKNLFNYVVRHDALRVALVPTTLIIAIGIRVWRVDGRFYAGDEPERDRPLGRAASLAVVLAMVVPFGIAIGLLAGEVRELPRVLAASADLMRGIPAYGFLFGALYFVGHLTLPEADARRVRVAHAMNALVIVTMTCSMIYNTSFIHFSPFYYNNPSIPLALLFLFITTERTRLPWVTGGVFALCVVPLFGSKLDRALSADIRVDGGQWAGMRVNYRGRELVKAATRIQELVGPGETALMLPEDVEFVGLMHVPRPALKGAIVFVDQYPRRLLEHDMAVLDAHPPKVIVIHPRRRRDWHTLYNTWNEQSAAQDMLDHVLDDLLPKHYEKDSWFPTIYFWDQGQLDIYVRKDDE